METHECRTCSDDGMVSVGEHYPAEQYPDPDTARLESLDDDGQAELWKAVFARRAAAAMSVRPCPDCRPELRARWAGGHLESKHNRAGCQICAGIEKPAVRTPERRDLA